MTGGYACLRASYPMGSEFPPWRPQTAGFGVFPGSDAEAEQMFDLVSSVLK
jgi:hypothetical protein